MNSKEFFKRTEELTENKLGKKMFCRFVNDRIRCFSFFRELFTIIFVNDLKAKEIFERLFQNKFPGRKIKLFNEIPIPLPRIEIENESEPISKILARAIEAEKTTYDFYISLSMRFEQDINIKKMLIYIAEMEKGHYRLVEIEKENAEKFEAYNIEWPMMHIGP
ncbi:hypothetical protein NLD30_01770 [SCandidatus Aminicenantes bacterium Aminicenantia_JdfR_composite]|jgi:type III secretory pathway component EscV|nr:hypothetical protein [SCandidatus Aminicenantes bacterium Aminicenantia_JdfR_composite]MCP2596239.1 hypothetical protein [Candidatus Aminicenantes bacterium AC-335-G13]MCP2606156.1 hypothetical protein [Candidatus Aminicenantes bacterium AC-708-I09]